MGVVRKGWYMKPKSRIIRPSGMIMTGDTYPPP